MRIKLKIWNNNTLFFNYNPIIKDNFYYMNNTIQYNYLQQR